MKIILSLTCLLFLNHITLFGQDLPKEEPIKKFKHGIGAGIGFTTGYGISYRYFPDKFGVQINFAPYHNKEVDRYSVGVTFLYKLIDNKMSNLYLYQGNHLYYNSYTNFIYDPTKTDPVAQEFSELYINNGLGFGMEFIISKRIGFNLMGGLASYNNFTQLNLTGETALYYKF
ncbi:MAG: hypothetical protein SGJ10_12790 [Bacteroidota bacterium]|nr:hypothetical protein [Bacteroidota bacterium]